MKKIFKVACIALVCFGLNSCVSCSNSSKSDEIYDPQYWESLGKETALRHQGLYEAAEIERKAREDYMNGGGYTSPDGGRQIHYKGSKEQLEHLKMIDERDDR